MDEENTFAPDSTGAVIPLDVSAAELIPARLQSQTKPYLDAPLDKYLLLLKTKSASAKCHVSPKLALLSH